MKRSDTGDAKEPWYAATMRWWRARREREALRDWQLVERRRKRDRARKAKGGGR